MEQFKEKLEKEQAEWDMEQFREKLRLDAQLTDRLEDLKHQLADMAERVSEIVGVINGEGYWNDPETTITQVTTTTKTKYHKLE